MEPNQVPRPPQPSRLDDPLEKNWYLLKGQDVLGPYLGYAIRDMVQDRNLGADTMVSLGGASEWQSVRILTEAAPVRTTAAPFATPYVAARRYAGFWIRVGASALDTLFLTVGVFVAALVVVSAAMIGMGQKNFEAWMASHQYLETLLGFVAGIAYYSLFTAGGWAATPGKRICNIYVIRESGGKVGLGRAMARFVCYYIDEITLFIGFMMVGWTREKTGLHDLICGTRVVYGRPSRDADAVRSFD